MNKCMIIDYGSGNLRSVAKALERAASDRNINAEICVSSLPEDILRADRIVLPGVGAFKACKSGLDAVRGLQDSLKEQVIKAGKPFLGICVGMQLMASVGREHEATAGLDWIPGEVSMLQAKDSHIKIPHMGWNTLSQTRPHSLLAGLSLGSGGQHAYFVHSYVMQCQNHDHCIATTDYGADITAIIGRDNLIGTQFHPEKSQQLGLTFLANFLEWKP